MSKYLNCPGCDLRIEADSKFCRGCGRRLESGPAESEAELLAQCGKIVSDTNGAMAACLDYLERFTDDTARHDVNLTTAACLAYASYEGMKKVAGTADHSNVWNYIDYSINLNTAALFASVPPVLKTGLVTQARTTKHRKLATAARFVQSVKDAESQILTPLFEQAQEECDSLLVDGKTRAMIERRTQSDVYDEAEIYYAKYQNDDIDAASRGFRQLLELNPLEAYFRNLMGAAFTKQERHREAVRELLFGFFLDPTDAHLALNLLRELTAAKLFGAALEVSKHHRIHNQSQQRPDAEKEISMFGNYAATILTILSCAKANISPADLEPQTDDLLADLPLPDRPWFSQPKVTPVERGALAGRKIFISYRRADGPDAAQRIHRKLKEHEPSASVFLDEAAMSGGTTFTSQIRDSIESADLFLLLIGPYWNTVEGLSRLNQTKDVVRREIALALRKGKAILPVLLEGADMPSADSLPDLLHPITQLHAEKLSLRRFDAGWKKIVASIEGLSMAKAARDDAVQRDLDEITEEDLAALGEAAKHHLHKYISVQSKHGEGIKGPIEWFGVWECNGIGGGNQMALRLIIEDRAESIVTGSYEHRNAFGVVTRHTLRGQWATATDLDSKLTLGLYIDAVVNNGDVLQMTIPFHDKVGDMYVGIHEGFGLQFSSRNVEPRAGGF